MNRKNKDEFLYCDNQHCPRKTCVHHINKTERDTLFYWTRYCKRGIEDKCKYYETTI